MSLPSDVDIVLVVGSGVILGVVACVFAYLKWRKPPSSQ